MKLVLNVINLTHNGPGTDRLGRQWQLGYYKGRKMSILILMSVSLFIPVVSDHRYVMFPEQEIARCE